MGNEIPEPMEAFESWLLRRVAQAVEAGEVPADLLTELQAEIEAARAVPEDDGHAKAVESLARVLETSPEDVAQDIAALDAAPRAIREWQMRRIAEEWLEGERTANRRPRGF